jgi:hypothetical protein
MQLSNAIVFRFPPSLDLSDIEAQLADCKLKPVGPLEMSSRGFRHCFLTCAQFVRIEPSKNAVTVLAPAAPSLLALHNSAPSRRAGRTDPPPSRVHTRTNDCSCGGPVGPPSSG